MGSRYLPIRQGERDKGEDRDDICPYLNTMGLQGNYDVYPAIVIVIPRMVTISHGRGRVWNTMNQFGISFNLSFRGENDAYLYFGVSSFACGCV